MLEPRSQEIPFRFGLDLTEDEEGSPNGALELTNFDFDKEGALVRRNGFTIDSTMDGLVGTSVPEAFLQAGPVLDVLARSDAGLDASTLALLFPGCRVVNTDCATNVADTYTCVVATVIREEYASPSTTYEAVYWVYEHATKKIVASGMLGAGTTNAQVVCLGSVITPGIYAWLIAYGDGTSTLALKLRNLSSAYVLSAATTVSSGLEYSVLSTQVPFALCAAQDGSSAYLAYLTVTTGALTVNQYNGVPTLLATISPAASGTTLNRANVWISTMRNNEVHVVYEDTSNNLILKRLTSTLSAVTATKTLASSLSAFGTRYTQTETATGTIMFFYQASTNDATKVNTYIPATDTLGTEQTLPGRVPYTKAMTVQPDSTISTYWAVIGLHTYPTSGNNYPSITLVGMLTPSNGQAVGQVAYDEASYDGSETFTRLLPSWGNPTGEHRYIPVRVVLETGLTDYVRRVRLVRIAFGADRASRSTARLGTKGFVSGSILRDSDGRYITPSAFLTVPETPTITDSGSGSTPVAGTYSYCSVLEYTDTHGTIQVSPPSVSRSFVSASGHNLTVTASAWAPYPYNLDGRPLRLKVYRTTAGGSTFYLLYTAAFVVAGTSLAGISFTDATTDAALTASPRETIYATIGGAALVSELDPALSYLCSHRNRLFGIDALAPEVIRFTTEIEDATAPRWNAVLTLRVDNKGGPPLALASLADKLVIFQRDQLWIVSGQGPDGAGDGAFALPESPSALVGVDPAQIGSVVETPLGVFFAHRTGIYLLTPGLEVVPVGQALGGKTFGATTPVTRGRYISSRSQVWFLASQAIYVYDLRWKRWLTWTGNWDSMIDVIDHEGTVYAISNQFSSGPTYHVLKLNTTTCRDEVVATPNTFALFSQTIGLPWFRADRAQEQRLYKVHISGRKVAGAVNDANVALEVFTQDERKPKTSVTADNTYTWAGSSVTGMASHFLLSTRAVSQRCRAFRCRLTVTPQTTDATSTWLTLGSLTYDFGTLPGRGKQPSGRRPTIA